MTNAHGQRIILFGDPPPGNDLCHLLEQAGHVVTCQPLDRAVDDLPPAELFVLDGSGRESQALLACRRFRGRPGESTVPILVILDNPAPAARLACLEAGADAYLARPFAERELLAQVDAFLRRKVDHDRLAEKTAEVRRVNERLQQTYQKIDAELELARRIQLSFLPQQLPEMPSARFAVHYRPCARVGGDFYDVFRLDEHHVGFYVADAMGHGMPAGLLTIFVKKGVRAKEIFGSQYRLLPPGEVLRHLNQDLIAQALADLPFITMAYGLFDGRSRTLRVARAGHPYPIHVPRSGAPVEWQVPGSLLGVFDTEFTTHTQRLQPGDRVLLYSDGLHAPGNDGESTAAGHVLRGANAHRDLPLADYVARLAADHADADSPKDDVTLLALEVE